MKMRLLKFNLFFISLFSTLMFISCGHKPQKATKNKVLQYKFVKPLVGVWEDEKDPLDSEESVSALKINEDGSIIAIYAFPYQEIHFGYLQKDGIVEVSKEAIKFMCDLHNQGLEKPGMDLTKLVFKFIVKDKKFLDVSLIKIEGPLIPEGSFDSDDESLSVKVSKEKYERFKVRMSKILLKDKEISNLLLSTSWKLIEATKFSGNAKIEIPVDSIKPFVLYSMAGDSTLYKKYNLKKISFLNDNEFVINNEYKSSFSISNSNLEGSYLTHWSQKTSLGKIEMIDGDLYLKSKVSAYETSDLDDDFIIYHFRKV